MNTQAFHHEAINNALAAVLPQDHDEYWSDDVYRVLRRILPIVQKAVTSVDAEIFADTDRGRALQAVINRHGLLHALCMHQPTRAALFEAARIISGCGPDLDGRRMVCNAVLTLLGETRPEGATIH